MLQSPFRDMKTRETMSSPVENSAHAVKRISFFFELVFFSFASEMFPLFNLMPKLNFAQKRTGIINSPRNAVVVLNRERDYCPSHYVLSNGLKNIAHHRQSTPFYICLILKTDQSPPCSQSISQVV